MLGPSYVLPQGQVKEKIITPHQMSAKWREEYGPIYRIWNRVWPKMFIPSSSFRIFTHIGG